MMRVSLRMRGRGKGRSWLVVVERRGDCELEWRDEAAIGIGPAIAYVTKLRLFGLLFLRPSTTTVMSNYMGGRGYVSDAVPTNDITYSRLLAKTPELAAISKTRRTSKQNSTSRQEASLPAS